ncbi:endopeptidase La [Mesoplasma lactucae]|uniref:Lon protease n=1 Tax=Mesoplasma lactucae ATCC 49193 TaxID=81460 RepID=A0A291IRE0_9MOLU|nr:endopeptidase La [Mesoplasma lactucae]ATG97343.1 endopeptidase La [Mesoplasma lactucae ATCC 49193]ATZ20205.1 class III heat-shock ATP-dependent LonA protease [Mesoplasma lactucae ATCC 49193]MCL8216954.1 Lon protease 1 [Mesoplasma lactucae ATCC 49193]
MNPNKKYPLVITNTGNLVFPTAEGPLEFVDQFSLAAIEEAISKYDGKIILGIEKNNTKKDEDASSNLYKYGILATVSIMKKWHDGSLTVMVKAEERVEVKNVEKFEDKFYMATAEETKNEKLSDSELADFKKEAERMINLGGDREEALANLIASDDLQNNADINKTLLKIYTDTPVIDKVAANAIFQELNPLSQITTLMRLIAATIDTSDIEKNINKRIKTKIDDQQKEFYLREKLRAIKEELNESGEGEENSLESYKKRLETEPYPKHVKERILSEIDKLDGIQPTSAEANIQRTYVDWMMSLPWWEKTEDIKDLGFAKTTLDKNHFGLKKVKDRILEHLAVMQKTDSVKGQIITLVGPPGVGKTSLAKSIAEAMGRDFVKVSLGGIRDEAEIRGHRKTYIGAMPGRIIQSMKRAKVTNPVFLLDEIDKMATDYKGDPSAAMLEVLDPEQNKEFSDNYIEEPYDLSNVLFIATANYPEDIPEALYDRMEIINLSSYTEIEKLKIAREYLVPKVLKEHNLENGELIFTDEALEEIIKYYTREAGVRQLERWLSSMARKFIVKELSGELTSLEVTPQIINEYLGKRIFEHTKKQESAQVGVVTGLAYTQFGGDILPIEVNYFPGKGNLVLTGKLGDVMKESAQIAFDYVRSNYKEFGIPKEIFEENDVHIHVPEGAVPKDGPSAGGALTTAIISALSNRPVSENIGMTGEITLRGHILPIGGLREKSISAARSGLKEILIPAENEKDLEDIPDEVKAVLKIKPVKEYKEVYDEVFNTKHDFN